MAAIEVTIVEQKSRKLSPVEFRGWLFDQMQVPPPRFGLGDIVFLHRETQRTDEPMTIALADSPAVAASKRKHYPPEVGVITGMKFQRNDEIEIRYEVEVPGTNVAYSVTQRDNIHESRLEMIEPLPR